MDSLTIALITYAVGVAPFAVFYRRRFELDGPSAIMCALSWPLLPAVLLFLGLGWLLEKALPVKK